MLRTTTSPGFWCECWTERLGRQQPPALFGSFDAYSAVEGNNWVATILRTISPALDTAASQEAWTWLHDDRIDTRRALLRREPWTVSSPTSAHASHGQSDQRSSCRWHTAGSVNFPRARTTSSRTGPARPTELQLSLLVQGGSLRSPRAARPPAGPALLTPSSSSPAGGRAARAAAEGHKSIAAREQPWPERCLRRGIGRHWEEGAPLSAAGP
ncbi:hypothetical protein FBY34_1692 [Streptomyces sp. SLBN-115]|nr:hypothetical protein FBY34_1692 [Streptomyces sp. SLBN-115]